MLLHGGDGTVSSSRAVPARQRKRQPSITAAPGQLAKGRKMSAEDGIRRTVAKYSQLFDDRQWEALGQIFTPDASITSRRGTFTGRAAVVKDLQNAMSPEYHGTLFTTNTLISVDGDTATARSDFLEVDGTQIVAVGTYSDTFALSDGKWLLTSKEVRLK
jgi:ketosteroid isomerase-like protein